MLKNHLLPILAILGTNLFAWSKILNQSILGEGYYYFDRLQNFFTNTGINNIWQYDNLARIIFDILPPIFNDNIKLYMIFQLLVMILLYLTLYVVILKVTKNKLIALLASIFFATNYVGSFEMMAIGNYQRFVQRVPNLIPALFSFLYLTIYFEKEKAKYLIVSMLLFALSVFFAHFSLFILPLFVVYPLTVIIQKTDKRKSLAKAVIVSILFMAINAVLVSRDPHLPDMPLARFLLNEQFIERTLYQIPILNVPHPLIEFAANFWPGAKYPYTPILLAMLVPIAVIYFLGFKSIRAKNKGLIPLYLTSILAMLGSMFLYTYSDRGVNPLEYFGPGRFYFVSSMFSSITLALLIYTFFNKNTLRFIIPIIVLFYIAYNSKLIWIEIDSNQYKSESTKKFTAYVKSLSHKFDENSIVLGPSYMMWPSPMFYSFYGESVKFLIPNTGWQEKYFGNRKNIFVLDYDYKKQATNNFNHEKEKVLDLTEQYRKGEKVEFLYE